MNTEREKNLQTAEWFQVQADIWREEVAPLGAERYERAAVALRKMVELEDESSVSTSLPVALFGVRTWLPSSIAVRVVEACKGAFHAAVPVAELEALQRYDVTCRLYRGDAEQEVDPDPHGDWHKTDDLAALIAKYRPGGE